MHITTFASTNSSPHVLSQYPFYTCFHYHLAMLLLPAPSPDSGNHYAIITFFDIDLCLLIQKGICIFVLNMVLLTHCLLVLAMFLQIKYFYSWIIFHHMHLPHFLCLIFYKWLSILILKYWCFQNSRLVNAQYLLQ